MMVPHVGEERNHKNKLANLIFVNLNNVIELLLYCHGLNLTNSNTNRSYSRL